MTSTPAEVVRAFLKALEDADLDLALSYIDADVVYTNVSLPSLHGRAAVEKAFRAAIGPMGFRVFFHAVGADENDTGVVLTERTDALEFGPVSIRFWVYGRFEVREGRITVWRDSFDWGNITNGLIRGLIGVAFPFVQRPWPTDESASSPAIT